MTETTFHVLIANPPAVSIAASHHYSPFPASVAVLEVFRIALPRYFLRLNDMRWCQTFRNAVAKVSRFLTLVTNHTNGLKE